MYNGQKVIDVHGHMSTPPHYRAYAYNMVALRTAEGALAISNELMQTALDRHLKVMDERNIDLQMISPRPVAMMHWERPFLVEAWTRMTNDIIHQQTLMHPTRYVGIAQLPQHISQDTSHCVAEFRRSVQELGFVGALVNPDPNGDRQTPGMNAPYWFPLYEESQRLRAPLIVHPSISRDPRLDGIPHSYQYNNITEEALAVLLLEHSDVFQRYPELRIVVCHCGGALDRTLGDRGRPSGEMGGGQVGMATREPARTTDAPKRDISQNLLFDMCAYDGDFMATAIRQRGVDRMLFGTEAPGSGTATLNPATNRPSDDLIPVLEQMTFLSTEDKVKILRGNALKYFPLLKVS